MDVECQPFHLGVLQPHNIQNLFGEKSESYDSYHETHDAKHMALYESPSLCRKRFIETDHYSPTGSDIFYEDIETKLEKRSRHSINSMYNTDTPNDGVVSQLENMFLGRDRLFVCQNDAIMQLKQLKPERGSPQQQQQQQKLKQESPTRQVFHRLHLQRTQHLDVEHEEDVYNDQEDVMDMEAPRHTKFDMIHEEGIFTSTRKVNVNMLTSYATIKTLDGRKVNVHFDGDTIPVRRFKQFAQEAINFPASDMRLMRKNDLLDEGDAITSGDNLFMIAQVGSSV